MLIEDFQNNYDLSSCKFINRIKLLLSLSQDRYQILGYLGKIARAIFEKGTIDPIKPCSLARVLTVTNNADVVGGDCEAIGKKLDCWNNCWGSILENSQIFL